MTINQIKLEGFCDFFNLLEIEAHYFDLGRRVTAIEPLAFSECDALNMPYPKPYLNHAWIGILFWEKGNRTSPMVWTIKLPLDEQHYFDIQARDLFIRQLITTMGKNVDAAKRGENMQAVLDNNPYSFTLPQERQAVFHAKASIALQRNPSATYKSCLDYLRSPEMGNWQELSIQGLADITARWEEHRTLLINAIPALPSEAFVALCQLLEHEAIDAKLLNTITQRLDLCLKETEYKPLEIAAAIRAISYSPAQVLRQQKLEKALALIENVDVEIIAAIASRCSHDLTNPDIALAFLELLVKLGQENFNQVITDLFLLDELKQPLRNAFRHPKRSTQLIQAIGELLAKAQQQ